MPVNPNSVNQQAARARLAQFATGWASLSAAQRTAWEGWAAIVSKVNKLGDTVFLTGFNWYVAINTQRQQANVTLVDVPSPILALSTFTPCTIAASAAANNVALTFEETDDWAGTSGGFLLAFASLPQPVTRNFFNGPFLFAGFVYGATTPPTSPATIALPYDLQTGQKVFMRIVTQTSDGRPSAPNVISDVA